MTKPAKSEQTRAAIVESAMRLFLENGYDRTTMRAIAADAGVSVGNAYYYFPSKEHLIQGFYDRMVTAHRAACAEILASDGDFTTKLTGVLTAWLEVSSPYHAFASQFFKNAADPDSPLSPFSTESGNARDGGIAIHRKLVDGVKVDSQLREDLPELLWLFQMGVVLFWVHDKSENQRNTDVLVRRSTPMIGKLLQLSRVPGLRSVTREAAQLFRDIGLGTLGKSRGPAGHSNG
ncbi:TetR family transcriptional regulator [Actinosynnema sp. NPDC047251]|uniref:Transcriptional regulator, TetR family n=1 Tax=Saccharothrix espanaensis (strain ATCC 51144 / DSM 44229 / JCM 9112 / NBRC 15066 / NRRL 15764) TaxID=1179773 RepID=K0JZS5_SACES|nr:TetR family transcriptional regulator [Saccharothrix espanaensis]CCH29803.1 Transcriptional regulator, TetR family [Saccharothrix espanaensis DSM 44229]